MWDSGSKVQGHGSQRPGGQGCGVQRHWVQCRSIRGAGFRGTQYICTGFRNSGSESGVQGKGGGV